MVHPKHPKCEKCGGALYKTRVKGQSTKSADKWRWCRNPRCENFTVDALTGEIVYDLEKRQREAVTKTTFVESPVVKRTREEVKNKLNGEMSLSYTLLLVVVAQELGYHDLGEKLIERFGLDEIYNIQKRLDR